MQLIVVRCVLTALLALKPDRTVRVNRHLLSFLGAVPA